MARKRGKKGKILTAVQKRARAEVMALEKAHKEMSARLKKMRGHLESMFIPFVR